MKIPRIIKQRNTYVDRIRPFMRKTLVKVMVGHRRVGKSFILYQLMELIRKEESDANIIYINKEDVNFIDIKTYKELNDYILSKSVDDRMNYIFVDEIQEIQDFRLAIRSLAAEESLKRNNALIDYIALDAVGGPTKVSTYAKGGNPEVLNYAYMGSTSDNPAYTYGMISPELVQLFGDNDERLNLFFKTTGNLEYYFDEGSGAALWNTALTYSKFQYMAVGMRTAEVYLILAEAMARLNDLSGSVEVLNQLREKRIKGSEAVLPEPATQREMMQEIINERRKELLFGFSRFWDLKRFNTEADYAKTITRTFPLVTTTVEQKIYTLKPDSRLYIIPFPVAAREKNPNLTLNTNE